MKNILKNIVNKELCNFGLWLQKLTKFFASVLQKLGKYPNYSVCDTKIVTGKQYKEWFHYVDKIAEWAKDQGCKKMEIFARPGYVPMFKERGYLATHVQVEKKL
jgi:hypothetical protein